MVTKTVDNKTVNKCELLYHRPLTSFPIVVPREL